MEEYKSKKVLTISVVSELTYLSERQIRYYEERKLIFPERTKGGTRRYSFDDIEKLIEIAQKVEKGIQTFDIRQEEKKKERENEWHRKMLQGQLNAQFGYKR